MIIDTHLRTIRYAVAGHPSPLVVDHGSGAVEPLISEDQPTPAAGLLPDTVYPGMEYAIEKPQTLLLYTDGVTEAQNPKEDEFGTQRLIRMVESYCREQSRIGLPEYLLEGLDSFMDTSVALDDICLVSIDIGRGSKK